MISVLIVLWLAAILLLWSDRKSPVTRWLAAVSFCGGSGALASILDDYIRPMALQHSCSTVVGQLLYYVMTGFSLVSYYGLPYCYIRFAGYYHPAWLSQRTWRYLHMILLLPIVLMLVFTRYYPAQFEILVIWAAPYIVFGTLLIISKRDLQPWERRSHWITTIAVVPAVLFALIMNYILPVVGIDGMWRYNVWSIAIAFAIFITALFKYGFLGVQWYIERRQLDVTLRAITSGTAILNHAIKNDLGKIQLFCDKVNSSAQADESGELVEDMRVIQKAAKHIQEMMDRVQHRTQDLVLKPEPLCLEDLVRENMKMLEPRLDQGKIAVKCLWGEGERLAQVEGDRAQIQEVMNNIMMNAVEAMPLGGALTITRSDTKKMWIIGFQDTGIGMDKDQLSKVIEPFYTTKTGNAGNFGLGLAYCYQAMKKHGGMLTLDSKSGQGTAVYLHFPKIHAKRQGEGLQT